MKWSSFQMAFVNCPILNHSKSGFWIPAVVWNSDDFTATCHLPGFKQCLENWTPVCPNLEGLSETRQKNGLLSHVISSTI